MQARPHQPPTPHTPSSHTDPCNVFVKFLPSDVDDGKLHDMFLEYGRIDSSKVMIDHQTGESLGFGFVRFETPAQAQEAIHAMNGKLVGTKNLLCKLSDGPPSHLTLTPGDNLYVKPLPKWITEVELEQIFSKYGNVVQCKVMIDRDTGLSREIGFVRFETMEQATAAIKATNGTSLGPNTSPLIVKYADNEEQKAERKQKNAVKYSKPSRIPGAGASFSPETSTNNPTTPKIPKPRSVSPKSTQMSPPSSLSVPQLSPSVPIAPTVPATSPLIRSMPPPIATALTVPHAHVHLTHHQPQIVSGHSFGLQGISIPSLDVQAYPFYNIPVYYSPPPPLPPPPTPPPQMFPYGFGSRLPKTHTPPFPNGKSATPIQQIRSSENATDVVLSIRPLPESYGKDNLYTIFDKYGQVKRVQIRLVDTDTSSALVGFVFYTEIEHAEKAQAEWNGKRMENEIVSVSIEKTTP